MANQIVLRNQTLLTTVQNVAQRCGFAAASAITDAAGSTDPAVLQFVTAVNDAMADMLGEFSWPEFITEGSISVVADAPGQVEKAFDLPDDFFTFIQRTQNDRTSLWPSYKSINAASWQSLQTIAVGMTIGVMWRVKQDISTRTLRFFVLYPPSTAHTFKFEYLSCGYVLDADVGTDLKNFASKNGDKIRFDPYLVELYAVAKWKEMKGFDTTTAMAAFARAYDQRYNRTQTAETISMAAGSPAFSEVHMIDSTNLPMTGYGT